MKKREMEFHRKFNQIFEGEAAALEKVAAAFHFIIDRHLVESTREMEVLRALGDKEGLIKEQIKHSTFQHALSSFDECYFRAVGESWLAKEKKDV